MQAKKIVSAIILVLVYVIAVKDTITLYYISGADFSSFVSHIPPSLIIGIVLIEALFAFMVSAGLIVLLIRSYGHLPPLKIPYSTVFVVLLLYAFLIIINNYVSGVFWYSAALLTFVTIFTIFSLRLSYIGQEGSLLPTDEEKSINEFEGLCVYIMELDPYRPPQSLGVGPYSFSMFRELIFKQSKQLYFIHKNPELHDSIRKELYPFIKKVIYSYSYSKSATTGMVSQQFLFRHMVSVKDRKMQKENDPYLKMVGLNLADGLTPFYGLFTSLLIASPFLLVLFEDLGFTTFYGVLLILGIWILTYPVVAWFLTRRRRIYGEKYNEDLKKAIQELIDYGKELIKKQNLNPGDFQLKLKHSDYNGLIYEKKAENNYIAHFKSE